MSRASGGEGKEAGKLASSCSKCAINSQTPSRFACCWSKFGLGGVSGKCCTHQHTHRWLCSVCTLHCVLCTSICRECVRVCLCVCAVKQSEVLWRPLPTQLCAYCSCQAAPAHVANPTPFPSTLRQAVCSCICAQHYHNQCCKVQTVAAAVWLNLIF